MITEQQQRQHLVLYFIFLTIATVLLLIVASHYDQLSWFAVLAGFLGFVCACGAMVFLVVAIWTWKQR